MEGFNDICKGLQEIRTSILRNLNKVAHELARNGINHPNTSFWMNNLPMWMHGLIFCKDASSCKFLVIQELLSFSKKNPKY